MTERGSVDANTRIRPHGDVVARRLGDETVLVQLGRNEIFSLNATGSRLWELVADGSTLGQAHERLLAEFDVAEADLRTEVEAFVALLVREELASVDAG